MVTCKWSSQTMCWHLIKQRWTNQEKTEKRSWQSEIPAHSVINLKSFLLSFLYARLHFNSTNVKYLLKISGEMNTIRTLYFSWKRNHYHIQFSRARKSWIHLQQFDLSNYYFKFYWWRGGPCSWRALHSHPHLWETDTFAYRLFLEAWAPELSFSKRQTFQFSHCAAKITNVMALSSRW